MSREFEFRVWEEREKAYNTWTFILDMIGNLFRNVYGALIGCNKKDYIVEQYAGLKDKNGKEIYEGDIVKAKIQGFWATGPNTICEGKATWNLEVVYDEIRHMNVFHILGSKNAPDTIYYLFEDKISDVEVIGNIHENPELLEGKR